VTAFHDFSTAANGTFINDGGTADGAGGSTTTFQRQADASNAVIIANGGTVSGAGGAIISFSGNALLNNATLICKGGVNGGGGGAIWFGDYTATNTNTARVKVYGNGVLDVEGASVSVVDIGSLEGDGIVYLGENWLNVGRNDLDTTFSGLLAGYSGGQNFGGVLKKIGNGTLILTGANIYAGHTAVFSGALVASNTAGSATCTGPVQVNAGTLGGKGTIAGPVTIGRGNGPGAVLAPSVVGQLAILTLQQALTFNADGTYSYKVNTNNARADQVIANEVTIQNKARFSFQSLGNGNLPIGAMFTVISNTSADPIAGTFSNLADGSTFTAGSNNFRVSYSGGDGNDLTLTVMP
jgi:autotransporter-associated beta strand protein